MDAVIAYILAFAAAVFAARCYASAALLAVMRCLSVRLCVVTFVHSVKTNKCIFKIISSLGSQAISFSVPKAMTIFRREPPQRGRRMQVG